MKITRRKVGEMEELTLSPITKGGEIVYSSIKEESDPNNPRDRWIVEYTPDAEEAIKVLKFLDEMNGIGWTPKLKSLELDLRLALLDLMTANRGEGE